MSNLVSPGDIPMVTIGMPVFNGAMYLRDALNSILAQTYPNFELVISDNCSTDGTAEICKEYVQKDTRIRYVRQHSNIGPSLNFKFVLNQARGSYFTWAAADDVRSPDFLESNVRFLQTNPDYVASTSPNCFEGQQILEYKSWVRFAIRGDFENRVMLLIDNCWISHAIFYSIMRTEVIRKCNLVGEYFLALDWAMILFLLKYGCINRTSCGLLILGRNGISNSVNPWRPFRTSFLSWVFPLYRFSSYALGITQKCSLRFRIKLIGRLLMLNLVSFYSQLRCEILPFRLALKQILRQKTLYIFM
jgi:glycosyltransferase involved in cell wall biosynthesis